jgi:two-component system CheB/CheR fusion protein
MAKNRRSKSRDSPPAKGNPSGKKKITSADPGALSEAKPAARTSQKKIPDTAADHPQALPFPLVGIGASAGGLEAFTKLLAHLPLNTGMGFVFVQHLDPKHESMLTAILSRATTMPVIEVTSGMRIEPDSVYVIPPGTLMSLSNGAFRLVARSGSGHQKPIDYFLQSLAEQCTSSAIGVVLSGSLSDGAQGLTAIKAEGGITFAQDDSSAKFQDMPRAAVAAGAVDFVLPPEEIARELERIARHPHVGAPPPRSDEPERDRAPRSRILALLRSSTGVDFRLYRRSTIQRRLSRRMVLNKIDREEDYADFLKNNPGEVRALYDDMLITVTGFFRDPESFEALKTRVFPELLRGRKSGLPIRIWVPGCATGEEVYSTAIALFECFDDAAATPRVQIFATDISDSAIEKSRAGVYLENAMEGVSPDRLRRFFVLWNGGYQISKTIRDVCVFSRQDVTSDPPFSNLDLLSCRNLLIYLEPTLQKRIIPLFHYALKPTGYLMLGNAETLGSFSDLFVPIDSVHRIFVKKPGSPRQVLDFGRQPAAPDASTAEEPGQTEPRELTVQELHKEADRLVLSRFTPAGVIVNDGLDVVQFRGHVGPYLEPASGSASFNVLKMAREGLAAELRSAVARARKTGAPARTGDLRVRSNGKIHRVRLEVLPIRGGAMTGRHYVVLFEPVEPGGGRSAAARAPDRRGPRRRGEREDEVSRLEQELTATKDYLQSIIEGQEASNEELKSANEEILSSNEELQSTNEELETAKEELQSANEELSTVNEELQNRNAELLLLHNDLSNLLSAINIPIVVLGMGGRIRRFTPPAQKLLNLIPTDVGRPLRDIQPNLDLPDLDGVVKRVIDTVAATEIQLQDKDGRWHLMRVLPYWTADKRIDGAVMAFVDIDPIQKSLQEVSRARAYSEALIETVRDSLIVLDDEMRIRTVNPAFCATFQTSPPEVEGRPLFDLSDWRPKADDFLELVRDLRSSTEGFRTAEIEIDFQRFGRKTLLVNARRMELPGEERPLTLLAIDDITERRLAEAQLRASEARYRQLFETAREGILIVDAATGALLDANPFLVTLVGYEPVELLGKAPWELPFAAEPEAMRIGFQELAANGFAFEADLELRSKSGRTINVESISSVYYSGAQKVAQYNLRDITARRELEGETRRQKDFTGRIVDSSLDGILAFGLDFRVLVWNLAMERIFGVRRQEAVGRDVFEVLPFFQSIGEKEYLVRAMAGENVVSGDRPYVSERGREGFFEGHYSPLRDEEGKVIGGVGAIREITSRKQFEDHLRQVQKLKSLGTLSGGIAHDFNNLLNIISAYTALLEKGDGAKAPTQLEAINKAVERGAALVRQLLTFARKSEVQFEKVNPNEVVEELTKLLRETFPKKYQLEVELAARLPAISADPNQIHQALLNLCVNARDAMPGGGVLRVKTRLAEGSEVRRRFSEAPDTAYVVFSVVDSGAGMDETTRTRLFEPFFTTKAKGRGAGLGLALVYGIVKSHLGFVDVETQLGKGSEFLVYLPVGTVRPDAPKKQKRISDGTEKPAAGTETILFAEDEEMLASAVQNLLEAEGYKVLIAKDGEEALKIYKSRKREIAVSILDLQMPRLGGWEAFLKMREIDPKARIVVASGDLDREQRTDMRKAGVDGSIRKPYSAAEVMRTIRSVVDRPS